MKKIKEDFAALTKKLESPLFKKFYDADKERRNDQKLSLTDWKPLAFNTYAGLSDVKLKLCFEIASDFGDTLSFEQYRKSI